MPKIIDVVKWNGAPNVFAYKFPSEELNTKTQLIVSESQEAVLVNEGRFFGPFTAGRHTLNTENIPFLTRPAVTLFFGSSPFSAEIWFVQKAIPVNILWGTTDPVLTEDPLYHLILPVRAFGQYGVRISDSMKFLGKLVGRLPAFTELILTSYLRGIIVTQFKTCLGKLLSENKISLLQMAGRLSAISRELQGKISEEVRNYGLEMISFQVNSISVNEEDPAVKRLKEALAKKAEMNILGYTYQQERSFDAMEAAAGGHGGAIISTGIGLGMGMGLASPIGKMADEIAQNVEYIRQNICPKCAKHNPAGTKYCMECGSLLESVCPKCGKKNLCGTKFCPECGTSLFEDKK